MFEAIVFYVFSAILVFSGLRVITARNTVHSALFLVLAFFTSSAIWLLLRAEFLAITLVLVYVGAVMVLFLFVVMMLDINVEQMREGFWKYLPLGALVGILIAGEMGLLLWVNFADVRPEIPEVPADYSNTKALGNVLYTDFVYPFELAAVVLLVAIIAAIALTMRRRKDTKFQEPAEQIAVRREDRVRLVSMPAEKSK